MIRRIGLLGTLVSAAGLLFAAPGSANAATTIGETFAPTVQFSGGYTGLQATSPGDLYAAQSPGVITSWSFQASASNLPQGLKLKIGRPEGDTVFTIIGVSGPKNPTASQLNTYTDVAIPIQTDDVIGLYMGSVSANTYQNTGPSFGEVEDSGDFPLGIPHTYGGPYPLQLDVSAKLEADADHDGFGDETQDQCPTDTSTRGACPVTPVTPPPLVKKKCKKHKKKDSASSAKKKHCKKKKKK
jgi:hypothetical protein